MNTILIPINNSLPLVTRFFKEKGAISEKLSIKLDKTDWISMGFPNCPSEKELTTYTYIKQFGDKFWLDETEAERFASTQFVQAPTIKLTFVHLLILVTAIVIIILAMSLF